MKIRRYFFLLLFLLACWFGMQIVHETGHVLAAWYSGATVELVALFGSLLYTILWSTKTFHALPEIS